MSSLESSARLNNSGDFANALRELDRLTNSAKHTAAAMALRADVMCSLGKTGTARTVAESLLANGRRLSTVEIASCEYVLGKVCREDRNSATAISHLQRAISLASQAKDLALVCRAESSLLTVLSDSGPDVVRPLIAELRNHVTRLGDPHVTAHLHICIGEMEAKAGLFAPARRQGMLALDILQTYPNSWLEAMAENLVFAIGLLRSDFSQGPSRGLRALTLAEKSGSGSMCRSCLGNLGNFFYRCGDFDRAVESFERALNATEVGGERNNAILESLARVRFIQGDVDSCALMLNRVYMSITSDDDRNLYANRHTEVTYAETLAAQGRTEDALDLINSALSRSARTGDRALRDAATLTKAEVLERCGAFAESALLLESLGPEAVSQNAERYVQYERAIATGLLSQGHASAAATHHDRAKRLARCVRNVPAELEVDRRWQNSQFEFGGVCVEDSHGVSTVLQGIASLAANAGSPEFIARELVTILHATGHVQSVVARKTTPKGDEILESAEQGSEQSVKGPIRTLSISRGDGPMIDLDILPTPQFESAATMNAAAILVAAINELNKYRAERDEEATVWPADEKIDGDSNSVISGHMAEVMNFARRIARVKVNVLITGESGTGKEIIARAIHDFSDRAAKPFVPFNCTAVPRDLLESQLFGHRRGAFTGADRDHTGLIRAAREGTLFLDEVGELGLDLQPKLLRFLESGEIAPLGEPGPTTVDVRIVAATNRSLDEAVREGRFREDLFYRLNVVRLSLKPLRERRDEIPGFVNAFVARAATDFAKGHLTVAEETMERLLLYRWPGNVRQLHNEIRRIVALAEPNSTILPEAISDDILGALPIFRHPAVNGHELSVSLQSKLLPTLAHVECEMIRAALKQSGGRVNAAAKALGISRKGLYLKRQRLGL
jgi:transcriptional regulator with PAS, ATPase and Fis domain/tetratricopeptide (TPR) repeat protein